MTGDLALELGTSDRTIRRVAGGGVVAGRRSRGGHWRLPPSEQAWLRDHWSLLSDLRSALRVEPSVRAAILFGSTASGTDHPASDVDLIVDMSSDDPLAVGRLRRRLTDKLGRKLDLFRLDDLEAEPEVLLPLLDYARPVVDRDFVWPRLISRRRNLKLRALERAAARQASLT